MTDPITLEALELGASYYAHRDDDDSWAIWSEEHGSALLAAARELLELRDAVEFVHGLSAKHFIERNAKVIGRTSPLQASEEK